MTLCERSNNTRYGTAGQCRKGTEVQYDPKEIEEKYKNNNVLRDKEINLMVKTIDPLLPRELDSHAMNVERVGRGFLQMTGEEVNKVREKFNEEQKRILERLEEGSFGEKEFKEYVKSSAIEIGMKDKVVIIGMEPGLSGLSEVKKDGDYDKYHDGINKAFAKSYASHVLKEQLPENQAILLKALSWGDQRGSKVPWSSFHSNLLPLTSSLGNIPLANKYASVLQKHNVGEAELRPLPVPKMSSGPVGWPYPNLPWVKSNPELSKILSSRETYYQYTDSVRTKEISRKLSEAFSKGELKTVIFATGTTNKEATTNMIDQILKDNPKAISREFTYQRGLKSEEVAQGRIIDIDGTGAKFIYDIGPSVNFQGLSWPTSAASLLTIRDQMNAERAQEFTRRMP